MPADPLLTVTDLSVAFPAAGGGWREVVRNVSFDLCRGERVALVGESGSGKSLTALATLGLAPEGGRIVSGSVRVADTDVLGAPPRVLGRLRGGEVGLVFQEAASVLNPVYTIGYQLSEAIGLYRRLGRRRRRAAVLHWLRMVAIDDPERVARSHPHQLSGGMAQRVMIALALVGEPHTLIADEPTSALDVGTQLRILELLERLAAEQGLGLMLISHDLSLVQAVADRVLVMSGGEIVDRGPLATVLSSPSHAASRRLVETLPRHDPEVRDGLT